MQKYFCYAPEMSEKDEESDTPLMSPDDFRGLAKKLDYFKGQLLEVADAIQARSLPGLKVAGLPTVTRGLGYVSTMLTTAHKRLHAHILGIEDEGKATAQDLAAEENLAAEKKGGKKATRKKRG